MENEAMQLIQSTCNEIDELYKLLKSAIIKQEVNRTECGLIKAHSTILKSKLVQLSGAKLY